MNLYIDLETSSLDPKTSQIVEIAIVDDTGRCLLSTRFSLRDLGLQTTKEINEALDYNKLSLEELNLYPSLDQQTLYTVYKILSTADNICSHNASFDKSFLEAESYRLFNQNLFYDLNWICTMELLAKHKGIKSGRVKLPNMQLDSVPHSAISDAQNARLLHQSLEPSTSSNWSW